MGSGDVPQPGRDLATRPWTSGTHRTVVTHGAWRDAVRAYLATVSFVDSLVGRVIAALDKSPHADNTWIILWSDHGYHHGEKGQWGKHTLWERTSNVPLIWAGPGITESATTDVTASLIDIYPTLCDLAGIGQPSHLEGHSFAPLLTDPGRRWKSRSSSCQSAGSSVWLMSRQPASVVRAPASTAAPAIPLNIALRWIFMAMTTAFPPRGGQTVRTR